MVPRDFLSTGNYSIDKTSVDIFCGCKYHYQRL